MILLSIGLLIDKAPKLDQRQQIRALYNAQIPAQVIAAFSDCSIDTVQRWINRIERGEDLADKPRSGRPCIYTTDDHLKLIAFYCQTTPFDENGRWTLRSASSYLKNHPERLSIKPSYSSIARMLNKHGIKPHRKRYFLHISDPLFFPKMEALVALYRAQPSHLYCFDECPGIQVLQRLAPSVLSKMTEKKQQVWLEEFEYIRHGTMDVFAFLHVSSGKVDVQCKADHTKKTFLNVFQEHAQKALSKATKGETVHYVLDNLAAHCSYEFCQLIARLCNIVCPTAKSLKKADERRKWLGNLDHKIVITFTPFHGSWLNMIEIWFGIMNQRCLKGTYENPDALRKAIEDWARFWNAELAHGFNWAYDGEGLHEKAVLRFVSMLKAATSKIPVKSLLKYIKLMFNLKVNYEGKIDRQTWNELHTMIFDKEHELRTLIQQDDKPKRKMDAEKALNNLLETMSMSIGPPEGTRAA